MKAIYGWLVPLVILVGCNKNGDAPVLDPAASFILHHPINNTTVKSGVAIDVDAYMKDGKVDDYSHLDYYVINSPADTVARGKLDKQGRMITTASGLHAGRNDIYAIAMDSRYPDKLYKSGISVVYVCDQPAVTASFEKDRNSITVKWTKADAASFKSYDLYVSRTDTMTTGVSGRGKKIASIIDIDQTSYKDNAIDYFYGYVYEVVVVSKDGCETGSLLAPIDASLSIPVPNPDYGKALFSRINMKWYKLKIGSEKDTILVIDAHTLEVDHKVAIERETGVINNLLQVTDNALLITLTGSPTIKVLSMDLSTLTVQPLFQFDHPAPTFIKAVVGGRAIIVHQDIAYELDPATGNKYTLPQGQAWNAWAIDPTTYLVSSKNPKDSFYVYRINASAAPTVIANKKYNNLQQGVFEEVISAAGKIALGPVLYDASFNEIHTFTDGNQITGISNDGSLLIDSKSHIIRASDFTVLSSNGDAPVGSTWFSADNKTIYPITRTNTAPYPTRAPRFYSYTWEK